MSIFSKSIFILTQQNMAATDDFFLQSFVNECATKLKLNHTHTKQIFVGFCIVQVMRFFGYMNKYF